MTLDEAMEAMGVNKSAVALARFTFSLWEEQAVRRAAWLKKHPAAGPSWTQAAAAGQTWNDWRRAWIESQAKQPGDLRKLEEEVPLDVRAIWEPRIPELGLAAVNKAAGYLIKHGRGKKRGDTDPDQAYATTLNRFENLPVLLCRHWNDLDDAARARMTGVWTDSLAKLPPELARAAAAKLSEMKKEGLL